jgi:hypothetical protein
VANNCCEGGRIWVAIAMPSMRPAAVYPEEPKGSNTKVSAADASAGATGKSSESGRCRCMGSMPDGHAKCCQK